MSSSSKKQPIPFGKYLLLDRINIGGMAEVWRGKSFGAGGFERLVAIKRILPNIAEDEEFITMFIDEAKITVQLTHANIAQIYELGHTSNSYFIAMEYIAGKDLRAMFDRCRKKGEPAPIPLTCYVMSKACEGLDYAHRKKDGTGRDLSIVHRDISPQNILVSYEGEVKVIDFGIAKAAGKASKTQAGILKGKFGYMSPEQIRGLPLDRRSDVFAAGVCLYEMLTGERLFVGDSDFSVLEKVRKAEVLPPSTYNRRIPDALEKIVLKALAKDVDDRYQYANEVSDDLQRFLITSDSIFSRRDLMQYMKSTFAEEVEREKTRLAEYVDIKPPAGMLAAAEAGYGAAIPPGGNSGGHGSIAPPVPPSSLPSPSRGPPMLSPALSSSSPAPTSAMRRTNSVPSIPRLAAVAPLLTNDSDEEEQSTLLVDRSLYDLGLPPKADPSPSPARPVPTLAAMETGPTAKTPQLPSSPPVLTSSVPGSPMALASAPEVSTQTTPAVSRGGQGKVIAAFGGLAVLVIAVVVGLVLFLREPPTGLILIEIPADARGKTRVNVNGDEIREADGKPPREWPLLRRVQAGKVMVLLNAEGYESFRQQVQVLEGQDVTTISAKLQRNEQRVQLQVVAEPAIAEISIDGQLVKPQGTAEKFTGEIRGGAEHQVVVKAAGYKPFQRTLTAAETAAPLTVTATLEALLYPVIVTSDPPGATIFIGETNMGQTPNNLKVTFGVKEVLLKKHCYQSASLTLKLPPEPKDPVSLAGTMTKQPNCR